MYHVAARKKNKKAAREAIASRAAGLTLTRRSNTAQLPAAVTARAMAVLPVQRLLQAVARHVQTPLDRADRRLELTAHLLERLAADVEGDERRAVNRLELLQPRPDFR